MISFLLIALLAIVSTEHPFLLYMIAPTCAILYLFESSLRKKILVYGAFFIGVIFYTWMRQPSIDDARIIKDTGVVTEITQYSDGYKIVVQTNLFSKYAFYREKTILERGDLVSFLGTMKPFATPSMPHMVDQRIYQASKGITGVIHIESLEKKGEVFWKALYQFREHLAGIYDRHLSSEASLLSKALTLRFSSEEQVFENMRSLGLGHLFSVSGLHVGLLALFFSFFLSFLLPTVKMRQLMSVFLLWMYALMVGFTPSITRAVLLYTLYVIKKLYIPYWSEMDILSGVAGIAILWNPYVVFNVGFQLSYLAVFGMIYFLPKWKGRRVFFGILGDGIVVLLSVQLMTLPFVIYYFNSYHGLNFLWNLLFVPLFTIYVMLSFTYLLLQSIPYVGFFISSILNLLAHGILWTTTHLQWKEMLWVLPSPSISWFLLYFTIIFVGGYKIPYQYVRYHQLRKMFYLLILCVLPGFFSLSPIRSVEFLSVGQGDAALISIGSKHYLIDTGGEGRRPGHIGKFVLEPYLVKSGRRKLDGVFITHFDYDHYGALIEMSDRIKMQHIISDHEPPDHVKKVLQENNLHFTIVPNDSVFKLGKGYFLRAIPYEKSRLDENGRSLVLQLVKGEESLVLFTGDITEAEEKKLLRYPLHSMVLKCPHHGSKSSSSEDFLIHVAPKDVAISVGYKNSFGHPHQEVLKRYRHHSIEIHRTDTQGLLQFDLRRHTWSHYKEEQELPIYFKLYAIYTTIIVGFTVLRIRREQWNICHF